MSKIYSEQLDLNYLLIQNQKFVNEYQTSSLMKLIRSDKMSKKEMRERLLSCIQTFSNYFQKVVMLRSVFCDDLKFISIAQQHLEEEFAHNQSLMVDRQHQPPTWDPILEATSSWFAWKMFTLDNEEKTLLIHFVLESSANIFFQEAHKVMHTYGDTNYFQIHSELDESHENLGRELLEGLSPLKYQRLLEVQSQGWSILNTTCDQIAKLTLLD